MVCGWPLMSRAVATGAMEVVRIQQMRRQREWIRSSIRTIRLERDGDHKAPRPIDGTVRPGNSNPLFARRLRSPLIPEVVSERTGPHTSSAESHSFEEGSRSSRTAQTRSRALRDTRSWASGMTPWIVTATRRSQWGSD